MPMLLTGWFTVTNFLDRAALVLNPTESSSSSLAGDSLSYTAPHLAFAPSMMGTVCRSLSDLTIFSVVALYFLK
jgi:hypothetical protein